MAIGERRGRRCGQLGASGLITLDGNVNGGGLWVHIVWPDPDAAVRIGAITGSSSPRRVLQAGASIADGHLVDLGDGLDRRAFILVLAVIAHAVGSHEHHHSAPDPDGVPRPGGQLPPLVTWPGPTSSDSGGSGHRGGARQPHGPSVVAAPSSGPPSLHSPSGFANYQWRMGSCITARGVSSSLGEPEEHQECAVEPDNI